MTTSHWFSESFSQPESLFEEKNGVDIWIVGNEVTIESNEGSRCSFSLDELEKFIKTHREEMCRRVLKDAIDTGKMSED